MTSYTLESKQWASQSIYLTWISMASLLLGISSMWVVLEASDTLGCLILMMPTQSFLSPPSAPLIRYNSFASNYFFQCLPLFPIDWVCFSYLHPDFFCQRRFAHLVLHFSTWKKTRGQTESTTHFSCSRKSALTPFWRTCTLFYSWVRYDTTWMIFSYNFILIF